VATISDTPDRTLLQRQDALARANEIRSKRAVLKRDLKAGRVSLAPLLLDPPEWLLTAKVFDIVRAVPTLGRVKVNGCFARERIAATKTVGGLSDRQRAALVGFLKSRDGLQVSGPAPTRGSRDRAQWTAALAEANRARFEQADIRQQIATGEITVEAFLLYVPPVARSMPLFDVIAAQHRWGRSRTRLLLRRHGLAESKTVGSLTPRQVNLIVESLRAFEARS
jgi:hypothetical protein